MARVQERAHAGIDARKELVALLGQVARGDKSAFARLYAATGRKLLGSAMNILRERGLAEDVLQEAYVKIWRNAASFDPAVASPISWMATIVRNTAIDEFRRRRMEMVESDDEMLAVPSADPDPADELDRSRKRALALSAFKRLGPKQQKLILQAFVDETSRNQLAAQHNMPIGTIKTHIHRAMLDLRRIVQDEIDRKEGRIRDAA